MIGEILPLKSRQYLLDTTTISDILRRNPLVLNQMRKVSPTEVCISSVSQYEIEYGFIKSPNSRKRFEEDLKRLYQEIGCIPLTTEIATIAATVASQLKEKGKPIGLPDVLIAATGLAENLVVVTSNTKHFERIKSIELVDWRK
ncbi:MAG: PIN domain-containing protein [Cyanobacteria bacterium P01_G01_bin.67]